MSGEPSDAELLDRVRSGDERAFDQLYERHGASVYNVALRISGGAAAAADVTQEVFLMLFQRLDMAAGVENLGGWLVRAAANRSIDGWRRTRGAPLSLELPDLRRQAEDGRQEPTPLDALLDRERADVLGEAIARLSPPLRLVTVLRHVEGLSYLEIAELLQIALGTVKSRIFRAHEALQALLAGRDAADEPDV